MFSFPLCSFDYFWKSVFSLNRSLLTFLAIHSHRVIEQCNVLFLQMHDPPVKIIVSDFSGKHLCQQAGQGSTLHCTGISNQKITPGWGVGKLFRKRSKLNKVTVDSFLVVFSNAWIFLGSCQTNVKKGWLWLRISL